MAQREENFEQVQPFEKYQIILNFVCWKIFGQTREDFDEKVLNVPQKLNRIALMVIGYIFRIFLFGNLHCALYFIWDLNYE